MQSFGSNLKKMREEKGMTQQTLADMLFVTRQAVSRWENNARYPDLITAKKIAQIFNTTLDALLSEDDFSSYTNMISNRNNSILKAMLIAYIIIKLPYSIIYIFEILNVVLVSHLYLYGISMTISNLGEIIVFIALLILSINKKLTLAYIKKYLVIYFAIKLAVSIYPLFYMGNSILSLNNINIFMTALNLIIYGFCILSLLKCMATDYIKKPLPLYFSYFINFLISFSVFVQFMTIVGNNVFIPNGNTAAIFLFYLTRIINIGAAFLEFLIMFFMTYINTAQKIKTVV